MRYNQEVIPNPKGEMYDPQMARWCREENPQNKIQHLGCYRIFILYCCYYCDYTREGSFVKKLLAALLFISLSVQATDRVFIRSNDNSHLIADGRQYYLRLYMPEAFDPDGVKFQAWFYVNDDIDSTITIRKYSDKYLDYSEIIGNTMVDRGLYLER